MKNNIYPFTETQQEALFQKLTHSLRCIVCQNQSLADSEAGLAVDLRHEIYQQVRLNKTETEVLSLMQERYGDAILYQPPFNANTYILWLGPLLLFFLGIMAFVKYVKVQKN